MATAQKQKRGPTVLVTDARENLRSQRPSMSQRPSTRLISVDNVLQYASQIPSGQRRGPPSASSLQKTAGGKQQGDQKHSGRLVQAHIPSRSSKVSEKLVLLPETDDLEEKGEFGIDDDTETRPPRDGEMESRRRPGSTKEKSYAERLPKSVRAEKLSRVTAYCTAQSYKLRAVADFLRTKHGAKTKLYDDCLYSVYHLPLLSGNEGYRVRSSPVLKSPGGKALLDEAIERNERHEYIEGFFGEPHYRVHGTEDNQQAVQSDSDSSDHQRPLEQQQQQQQQQSQQQEQTQLKEHDPHDHLSDSARESLHVLGTEFEPIGPLARRLSTSSTTELEASLSNFAEMFAFSYGVVVFWNFTERQEKDILADLTFYSAPGSPTEGHVPLVVRPLPEQDFETEEFHFEYNPEISRPRVFNDMITLRSSDHMIKLSMSHAIAQSTKLSFFEERMAETMEEAQYVPKKLALEGKLGMKREEVVRILGRLFTSRVDVNLSSNMLDVPNFFWDSEPTLHPLYLAVREYLEIKPRIQVLNERCRVFLDLAEILTESINDRKMSRLTWIIIILIVLSIIVTTFEVFLRFGIVTKGKPSEPSAALGLGPMPTVQTFNSRPQHDPALQQLQLVPPVAGENSAGRPMGRWEAMTVTVTVTHTAQSEVQPTLAQAQAQAEGMAQQYPVMRQAINGGR